MSTSRDVDVLRRAFDAWNEGAFEEWKAMHHEDVVVIPPPGWPEGEPAPNRDAWFTQAMRLTDSWEEQQIEIDELREVGAGRVLAAFRWVTRGKGSGIELATPLASISTVRDGRIARQEYFSTREAALEALEGAA